MFNVYMNNRISSVVNKLFNVESEGYVFIYTPPKVGSTTLVSSLRVSLGNTYSIVHIHDEIMLNVLTGVTDVSINEIIIFLSSNGKRVYVIDVYRTPIERKMSEFFEKISPYHFNNSEENINNYSIKRVSERFNSLFPHIGTGDHYLEKYNIGDNRPFDFKKKYMLHQRNNITYVKLRLCDSSMWAATLSTIFASTVVMITDYQTDNKGIGELYKRFKHEYKLPANYLEDIKNCRYLKLYYSEHERDEYLNMWQQRACHSYIPYSPEEYKFYMKVSLENQYINDIQAEHYIDHGCRCPMCSSKRRELFTRVKNGENVHEKIIHSELSAIRAKNIQTKIKNAVVKRVVSKFEANQFSIKLGK
jgi:hypothetical protein